MDDPLPALVLASKSTRIKPFSIALQKPIKARGTGAASVLTDFQARHAERLEELALGRARIESEERISALRQVNHTMRAEAQSEHWPQWSWRPFNGFMFGTAIVAIYFVLPLLKMDVPDVPVAIWVLWGSILGVATIGRNKEKRVVAGDTSSGPLGQLLSAIKG